MAAAMATKALTSGDSEAFQVKRVHNMVVSYFQSRRIPGKGNITPDEWIRQQTGYVSRKCEV